MVTKKAVAISLTSEKAKWRVSQKKIDVLILLLVLRQKRGQSKAAEPGSSMLASHDMLGKTPVGWRAEVLSLKGRWLGI
jgi:hypothetical protein